MRREKIFILIIAVLIIANITTLAMLLCKGGKGDHARNPDRMKNYLKQDIGFTESQLGSYDSLYSIQQQNDGRLKNSHDAMELRLRDLSNSEFSDSIINLTVDVMSSERKDAIRMMFIHLREIRLLCTPDQLPKFDSTVHKMFKKRKFKNKK